MIVTKEYEVSDDAKYCNSQKECGYLNQGFCSIFENNELVFGGEKEVGGSHDFSNCLYLKNAECLEACKQ